MRTTIAALKFTAFVLLCLVVVPTQTLLLLLHKGRYSYVIPHLWHKGVCTIFGINVTTHGKPITDRQVFFVGNHLSYLDISLIATQICFASFVAKQDVSGWPVFGYLSKLQQTIFISRSRSAAIKGSNALEENLDKGKSLIIFPEGTSTDGLSVLPFKSSLFALLLKDKYKDLLIQPFTLEILSVDGKSPDTREIRNTYAWPFDDEIGLGTHLLRFAKGRGAQIVLTFHEPLSVSEYSDRKALAKTCHDAVSKGLHMAKAA
jgi:1-acyl-sn-glycerol-3-phosphate acyltransferase